MKIHLEQTKVNHKFHGKKSGFVDSRFVKTCDEPAIGQHYWRKSYWGTEAHETEWKGGSPTWITDCDSFCHLHEQQLNERGCLVQFLGEV